MRTRRFLFLAFSLMLIQGRGQDASSPRLEAPSIAGEPSASVPTRGLIHWWPDPWTVTDAITGRQGVRRGFGPVPEDPANRFGYTAGWVELGPGITNRTFTLAFWLWTHESGSVHVKGTILSQDGGANNQWCLIGRGGYEIAFETSGSRSNDPGPVWSMPFGWNQVVVSVTIPTVTVWVDGHLINTGQILVPDNAVPGPLCVGNHLIGNEPWNGDLRDLRIFDRILEPDEIRQLAEAPLPRTESQTPARIRERGVPVVAIPLPGGDWGDFRLRHYTTANGLPTQALQCLQQASDGILWIGSEVGLTRFDGKTFSTDDATHPGLARTKSNVKCLGEASDRSLWVGTFHGLIHRIGTKWTQAPDPDSVRYFRRLVPTPDGKVWTAGYQDWAPRGQMRVRRFNPDTERCDVDFGAPGQIRDLRLAPDGLWIVTDEPAALWRFREGSRSLDLIFHLSGRSPEGFTGPLNWNQSQPVVRLSSAAEEQGVRAEAWRSQDASCQWARVRVGPREPPLVWRRGSKAPNEHWELDETATGDAISDTWISTSTGLLYEHEGQWQRLTPEVNGQPIKIYQIASSLEGGVWAATKDSGLWLVMPHLVQSLTRREGLPGEDVLTVASDTQGRLIVGGDGRTDAFRFNGPRSGEGGDLPGLQSRLVAIDHTGTIWGSNPRTQTLWRYEESVTNNAMALLLDDTESRPMDIRDCSQVLVRPDSSLWMISGRGAFWIQVPPNSPGQKWIGSAQIAKYLNNLPPEVSLMGAVSGPNDTTWVGSRGGGLFQIQARPPEPGPHPDGYVARQRVTNFSTDDGLVSRNCVPIEWSSDNTLWLGSDSGLGILRNGRFQSLRMADGLPEPNVLSVKEAGGYLWLAGLRGIHGIRKDEIEDFFAGRTPRVHSFTLGLNDGLPSTQFPTESQPIIAKTPDGRVWVATSCGLAGFQPETVVAGLRPPPVTIEGLKALGESRPVVAPSRILRLPPGHGQVVEISFRSVSFVDPDQLSFEYVLKGPGQSVSATTREPRVLFTNLRPGRHQFQVAARNGNGLVSQTPASIAFDVDPHFYETEGFFGVAGFGSISLFVSLVGWRVRRVRQHASREQELRLHKERQRIARDMHDELGAELSRLALRTSSRPPDQIPQSGASDSSSAPDARALLRSLDETVWLVNPSKDTLDSVVNYLGTWVRDYFKETSLEVSLELPTVIPELSVSAEWRHHVLRLVKEVCHNILKHARATRVDFVLKIHVENRSFELELRDDGCGFEIQNGTPASESPADSSPSRLGGNGLGNLHQRADQLNGHLHLQSAPGQGTRVRLTLPLRER